MHFALGVWVCEVADFGLGWLDFVVALLLGFVVGLCFCFSLVWCLASLWLGLIWLEGLGFHRLCCVVLDDVAIWYKVGGCELLYVTLSRRCLVWVFILCFLTGAGCGACCCLWLLIVLFYFLLFVCAHL